MPNAYVERRWTSRDGLTLYARDYAGSRDADALPVICLHGLTRNSKDFEDIAPVIARLGRRVIVPDVRGRGLSDYDPKPARYQPRVYARDVADMMKELGISRAIFLGTSMGGLITMTLAAMHPKLIAAAILNDVGPEIAPEGVARILSYAGKAAPIRNWADAVAYLRGINGGLFPKYVDDDWDRLARRTFKEVEGVPSLDYDPHIAGPLSPPGRLTTMIARWLFKKLAGNRPTLLLRGALSDLISADIAKRMKHMVPSLDVVEVPDVGHAPMLDEPAAVDAITRFLRTVP